MACIGPVVALVALQIRPRVGNRADRAAPAVVGAGVRDAHCAVAGRVLAGDGSRRARPGHELVGVVEHIVLLARIGDRHIPAARHRRSMSIPLDHAVNVAELGRAAVARIGDRELPGAHGGLADHGLRSLIPSLHTILAESSDAVGPPGIGNAESASTWARVPRDGSGWILPRLDPECAVSPIHVRRQPEVRE